MKIDETYQVKCIDLNHDGLGVVKIDNFLVFVEGMLPTEEGVVKITKINSNYGLGELVNLITKSSNRVKPLCPYFGICGGCDLMHMSYDAQLSFKLKMVNETLKRIGHLDYEIKEAIGANNPYYYRNKVQIPYKFKKKNIRGFYKKKSHDIVEVENCLISPNQAMEISTFIRNIFNEFKIKAYDEETCTGVLKHVLVRCNYLDEYMVVLICHEKNFSNLDNIVEKIKNRYNYVKSIILNYNPKKNNTILGDEYKVLYGNDYLIEDICGLKFKMSHKAFFQINHEQTVKLYNKIIEFSNINNNTNVLDLYCGVGTISLTAAKYASSVVGVEVVSEAIDNAKENVLLNKDILNAKNIKFVLGKSEDVVKEYIDKCNLLIVDPPRKGLDINVIKAIKESKINKMIYVSCDCATLARDLDLLSSDYVIDNGAIVDMFPNTSNVETVVQLFWRTGQLNENK